MAAAVAHGPSAMAASSFATEEEDIAAIEQAVSGDWRKRSRSRDVYRHPVASLEFGAKRR
jgi:hypothetical protein